MDSEIPEVIEGQTSINELLLAMGEPAVEPITISEVSSDVSALLDAAPMLPGF